MLRDQSAAVQSAANTLAIWATRRQTKGQKTSMQQMMKESAKRWPDASDVEHRVAARIAADQMLGMK